jgi:hypothetical protein
MFRKAHLYRGTLIMDEVKLTGKNANFFVEQLIKNCYKKGMTVPRVTVEGTKNLEDQIQHYNTFMPVVMCTTESIDDIVGSRCIKYVMTKNTRKEVEQPIDLHHAEILRERLLYLRKALFNTVITFQEPPARRRLGEIIQPLYQVLMLCDPTRVSEFTDFVTQLQLERKEEESETYDAEVAKAITDFLAEHNQDTFTSKDICTILNKGVSNSSEFKHSDKGTGHKIMKLGFRPMRVNSKRVWKSTPELLAKLKEQYDIPAAETMPF